MRTRVSEEIKNNTKSNDQMLARVPISKIPKDKANTPSAVDDAAQAKADSAARSLAAKREGMTATLSKDSVETDMEMPRRVGLGLFMLVFVIFGGWAALAPIDGAARAPGQVTVKTYKKAVQHLEGGIVKTIFVENGDVVSENQPLLEMDDTQPLAQLEIANSQLIALQAREARLIAERDNFPSISFPDSLATASAREEVLSQISIFEARKAAREGSVEVLEQRIEQLESKLIGLGALKKSKEALANSFADELADTRSLLEEGFSDKARLRSVERNLATYQGEAADLTATISSTQVQIGETRMQILQQNRELQTEIVNELGETQTRLKDAQERSTSLTDVLNRTVVRAPVSGVVNGMQVHTEGGVIGAGATIAEIVPLSDELILEAQVSPMDIDRVFEGQAAKIRFSSFGSKTPMIEGRLLSLSADAIIDQNSGLTYYLARVEVTTEGMANLEGLELLPGMPAEVLISTGSRTLLQYLFKPFSNAMARSFIED